MAENVASTALFNPAVTFIITQVLKDLVVIDEDETPTASQFNTLLFALNSLTKTLQATGIHVWTEEEEILFLQAGEPRYIFAGTLADATAKACQADSFVANQLEVSYAAATTVIALEVVTGVSSLDNIGVVLDDGSTWWTTISGAPSGHNVTLAAALPSSASSGNFVFTYAPGVQTPRPLKVPRARLYTYNSATITSMTILSRQEYMDLPNPANLGTPSQWFYDPRRSDGWFYVWQNPSLSQWGVRFTSYRSLADFLVPNNTADFPQEWIQPLRWLLADDQRIGYSVPAQKQTLIKEKAAEMYDVVQSWDRESEPVQFGMDWQWR